MYIQVIITTIFKNYLFLDNTNSILWSPKIKVGTQYNLFLCQSTGVQ